MSRGRVLSLPQDIQTAEKTEYKPAERWASYQVAVGRAVCVCLMPLFCVCLMPLFVQIYRGAHAWLEKSVPPALTGRLRGQAAPWAAPVWCHTR